ncbi:hypothetical protein PNOK_0177600 [Pyrrhoderma noxium]|uniref:ABM domain-containing protein n=1 Tax=Pyrrhoderma noxium TaxID=2282107 RepID=A0A286UQK6_9AGAM|nr:hypothetical protein PNOK_0177600 [Pyrrhoderma noxium]
MRIFHTMNFDLDSIKDVSPFIVNASFFIKPDKLDEFVKEIKKGIRETNENEPDVLQFSAALKGNRAFLWEVYKNKDTFIDHMKNSPMFIVFQERQAEFVEGDFNVAYGLQEIGSFHRTNTSL